MALKIESNIKLFHAIFPSFIRMSILIKNSKKKHIKLSCSAKQGKAWLEDCLWVRKLLIEL